LEKRPLNTSCPLALNNWAPTGRNLIKVYIWAYFENLSRKFKFYKNPTRITGTLHEDISTFMAISGWIFLTMRNVLDKSCREN
jgi:hypothetical protein